jgi:hypothetical protein
MRLYNLNKESLESLLHHLVEAERILNVKNLKLSQMDPEADAGLIQLNVMKIQVFGTLQLHMKNRERKSQAKDRIKSTLMSIDPDLTDDEADDLIENTIELIRNAESLDEVEEIWDCEFGIEMDDLNDLMGW